MSFLTLYRLNNFLILKVNYLKNISFNRESGLSETYRKASKDDISKIKYYKTFKNSKFIEYPKSGF